MTKFNFTNDTILEIGEHRFEIDSTDLNILQKISDFAENSQKYADTLEKSENFVQAMKESIQYTLDLIEDILGEGSVEKIFKDESISLNKSMQVINYIFDEIGKARGQTLEKYEVNRATRRKTAPKKK